MDLIGGYGSDEDTDSTPSTIPQSQLIHAPMCSAPLVSVSSKAPSQLVKHNQKSLMNNPSANVVLAPMNGPAHPFKFNVAPVGAKQAGMGQIEETAIEDWTFNEQYQTYQRSGFAMDSSSNAVLGDYEAYVQSNGDTAQTVRVKKTKKEKRKRGEQELADAAAEIGDGLDGPWAPEPKTEEEIVEEVQEVTPEVVEDTVTEDTKPEAEEPQLPANMHIVEPDEEEEMWERVNERKISYTLPPRPNRGSYINEAKSTFHGGELFDYQGRSWVTPPSGIRPGDGDHECFIPKKCIKKYTGHTKGVQAIEFFPGTGHLILSASLDGKCKIWDVYGDRNVKRTYVGHNEAVRSIHMSNDGMMFLSSAFDRYIRLWDTETGQVKGTFSNRKMAYQVKFYPNDNNIFLAAASDNKIYQWDARTGGVVQEYNYHLQPCSTITFFDEGRRFVSTSDDKKILVWEYDIPVPIKYIQDPTMHSVPSVTLSPSGTHFAGQSMDNSIVVYQCGEKVKQLRRRVFRGHSNSGYACQVGFSPNEKFLISGDAQGKLHVWDWKTTKPFRKFQAHDSGPCMGAIWHPLQPSWIATCGWDGLIKLWD
eukprot:CAMPEP_0185024920 /NCGR_PEP_ID=MMETSP1103-20130426/8081_1 /TAXON_ID=36769 /ORGANISM="Paraphysomonas bandaiensis, Strain Caron Lab Isolate" /LENGTH=589 /DNA_ID=CAMNT_0027558009 /DNA_START=42 /DNA_END=1811 /DNA_ORIENTATION=-